MSESHEKVVVLQTDSRKEKFFFHNTLICLVKALEGSYTLIDLRNESSIAGKIVKVDGFMNVEMEEAVYTNARGDQYYLQQFFVRHRNIRYVHIPKETPSLELIQQQLDSMRGIKKPKNKKRTFKQIRAERYQKEIVQSLK